MPAITILFGLALTALGLWGYLGNELGLWAAFADHPDKSITALIPAFVGAPMAVLGACALKESWLKHTMHAAAMLGLLGFLAGVGRLGQKLARDGSLPSGVPGVSVGLLILLCAVFVGLCINSFVAARRRRAQTSAAVR